MTKKARFRPIELAGAQRAPCRVMADLFGCDHGLALAAFGKAMAMDRELAADYWLFEHREPDTIRVSIVLRPLLGDPFLDKPEPPS